MWRRSKNERRRGFGWQKPDPAALFEQGLSLANGGQQSKAIVVLSHALLLKPGSAEGHNNLGMALQQVGKVEEAISSFRRAVAIRPSYALAYANLGAALATLSRHEEALEVYNTSLQSEPQQVPVLHNAGAALVALGRHRAAIERFRAAIAIEPEFVESKLGLAHALGKVDQPDEAIEVLRELLTLQPAHVEARLQLAAQLLRNNSHEESLRHYAQLLEFNKDLAAAWSGRGRVLQEIGQVDEARDCFRQAIFTEPRNFRHYLSLANSTRLESSDPALRAMLEMVDQIDHLPEAEQISAHFALGKALSDIGRHREAFDHILQANKLRRKTFRYNEARTLRRLQSIKDTFTPEYLARWPSGSTCETPIFIVGMPRSGSTLVEQILAAHPDVVCAGESPAFRDALKVHGFDPVGRSRASPRVPTCVEAEQIASSYLALVRSSLDASTDGKALRVTDKMLNNFRYVGLITKLFPNAKIIHTFRDPIESCLSSFRINFDAQPFSFNLGELGRYYRAYAILMAHWRRTLPPGTIFDVRYEAVVQDLKVSAEAIIAHCGLPWNEACLRFHEVNRPVKTASVEQVRRPIYRTSVRTSRPDPTLLKPLLDGLNIVEAES